MLNLEYDYDEKIIYSVDKDGEKRIVSNDFPSEPKLSPSKKFAVYISPLEWECYGSVYLYDLTTGAKELLVSPDEERRNIPKDVAWIDDNTLAIIIGFGDGTIQIGGNVYLYFLDKNQMKRITYHDTSIQLTKLIFDGKNLKAEGIVYIDDQLNKFKEYSEIVDIQKYRG